MVEVDQHHDAGLGGDAGQRDEAHRHRHRQVVVQPPHQPHAADGVGYIQPESWDRTVSLAKETKNLEGTTVLTADPDEKAYTNEIIVAAHDLLKELGVDINGSGYAPVEVTLTEGGV